MRTFREAVIVGAGPAGAAAALALARAGSRVAVMDARLEPGATPCGEGIMPAGVQALAELGLAPARLGGHPFHGIAFFTRGGTAARGRFPAWAAGLAVPRAALHRALWSALERTPGIELLRGHGLAEVRRRDGRVVGVVARDRRTGRTRALEAALTIGADGLYSRFHALPGVTVRRPARRRFGLAAPLDGVASLGRHVEVHVIPGGEIYVTPQGPQRASIALLVEEERLPRPLVPQRLMWEMLAAAPALSPRLASAQLLATPRFKGPLGSTVEGAAGPGYLLCGDAAGGLDPLTGEGVALALAMGAALGRHAARLGAGDAAAALALADRRALELPMRLLTTALLTLTEYPACADLAVCLAGQLPGVFSALLEVAAGHLPVTTAPTFTSMDRTKAMIEI